MISIILSTYKPHLLKEVLKSIEETIGEQYEIIAIENHNRYSICEAYNLGVSRANYPFLCFVHEDVLFKTNEWGKKLISIMSGDNSIGLIGVAGTKFKSTYPSALGQGPQLRQLFMRGHIYHWGNEYTDFDKNKQKKEVEDVVCVDGVFMFTKKDVFRNCRFDDKMLKRFHGYDIDFSLQVFFQSYRVIVDRGILLDHHSSGDYSAQNTIANRLIGNKWKSKLPVATKDTNLNGFRLHYLDILNWFYFLLTALKRKISNRVN